MKRRFVSLVLVLLSIAGCRHAGSRGATEGPPKSAPLFDGMGSHHRVVTTASPTAQRYFDQGLVWTFSFNHDEAIRSYQEAAKHDPDLAMAWWGIALCNGPHINNPAMDEPRSRAAHEAVQKASALQGKANPVERELIQALSRRYAWPAPADRKPLDEAYAAVMRDVWRNHRTDPDVGALFAEAMMDLRPWDLWTKDGKPQPGTEEIVSVLEEVLRLDSDHPGANHLYIHAVEASPTPERAIAAADRLRKLVPASGHMVHMPAHIYVRVGRWSDGSICNEHAMEVDRKYRKISPRQGFYHIYMAHNPHFLSWSSMMEGRSESAVKAARAALASVPKDYAESQSAFVDPFMNIVLESMMRFGRWDDILREPAPPAYFPITTAFWHFTRGIAFAAKGDVSNAEKEQAAFRKVRERIPADARMAQNTAKHVLDIGEHMLTGEIAYRRGEIDNAVAELRQAVQLEDELSYMEAPDWLQPVRHTLGAVLLSAGRFEEAERVYRDDLKYWPENGWALYGLSQSLRSQGKTAEAEQADARFRKAWARADIRIDTTCLCIPGGRRS